VTSVRRQATTATVPEARIRKRRIVERPRLFALLDQSTARVRMLVAPAGYGKTTLAEQWAAREGRRAAWFTARPSSTDVAALALGLARTASSVIEGCDHRLREHLRALPAPAENVQTLAEILSEDLAGWPQDTWLVLDDYHEVAPEPKAEDFVDALVALSSIQVLIASRVRPRWIATKSVLYGEVLELTQAALAMNNDEAADVLLGRPSPSTTGLVALAEGWPAVIGLASASLAEVGPDVEQVPESLYRFFADEVFAGLHPDVQQGLTTLCVAPVLDRELAVALLGASEAESVCAAALDVGLIAERGPSLELHPLARIFLDERGGQLGLAPVPGTVDTCLSTYQERRDWDAAFELISRAGVQDELSDLISLALDELLETARLSTLERWCDYASTSQAESSIASLARAEVLMRTGHYLEAVARAESASSDPTLTFRSLSVAGRAAHLASREEAALDFYGRAELAAENDSQRRDAKWGQLVCLIDLEHPDAEPALLELSAGVSFGDAREVVRMATHRIYIEYRTGGLKLDHADIAHQLIEAVSDPLVETSFLSAYSSALALAARYEEAERAARRFQDRAERYRLDFAVPYAQCAQAAALGGRRQWARAEQAASDALTLAQAHADVHAELLSRSLLIRLFVQQGRLESAFAVARDLLPASLQAIVAEAACSRALALACARRVDDALGIVDRVRGTTGAVEATVLISAVEATCALRGGSRDAVARALELGRVAFETGGLDILVASYRGCPELLSILLRSEGSREFRELVERVGDSDLAAAAGHRLAANDDRRLLLSPREREVFELLRNGFTNRQIAKLLFIEQSTVKVHAHHIYDKLGVRSRSALTVQAALERSAQATSAMDDTPADDGSSDD
jgi:ATP/maltotriose-dependent transcriptional regulator MalT